MGSRCWECGEKFGRCYEHARDCDCSVHSCVNTLTGRRPLLEQATAALGPDLRPR